MRKLIGCGDDRTDVDGRLRHVRLDAERESGAFGAADGAMRGLMILSENAVTMAVNAPPMITAVANSTTFPWRMKSLKPLSISGTL